ncbi:MAG: phosphate ABC transporter permease, partial [Colwellia sp.]|nr:phosphate ABC transporter permease [Colwellia sp.]
MTIALNSSGTRRLKNSLAKWLITLGGISVLFTLVLIFMYLLYVIKPIFNSAKVEPNVSFVIDKRAENSSETLSAGLDELQELAYQINKEGIVDFYQLKATSEHAVGYKVLSKNLLAENNQLDMIIESGVYLKLLIDNQNNIQLITPQFKATYTDDTRTIIPSIGYPLGNENLIIDQQNKTIKKLAFAMTEEQAMFIAFTDDNRLIKTTFIAEDDFNYDPAYETNYQEIDFVHNIVDDILITPDLTLAFIRSGNIISIFELDDEDNVSLKAEISSVTELTTMALLSGGSSILLGDNAGTVSQWFEVAGKNGRQFKQIRTFTTKNNEAVSRIVTEQFRKSFYTMTLSGVVDVFYTTSEAHLWQGKISDGQPNAMVISPRADGLLLINENKLELFSVENEHPEVTLSALWQEVWYEGYPEPDFIWQSTSGSDDFEGKFSLVPISFGTIKAALYAMLFAVPIALSAAIYTAYFMTPGLRKKVKPTIELMEALPTVILGFLAGLWLAPLIEDFLPAVFLLVIFLPCSTLITAFAWHNLPKHIKNHVPETLAPLILIPVLLLAGYAAFSLSPVAELHLF